MSDAKMLLVWFSFVVVVVGVVVVAVWVHRVHCVSMEYECTSWKWSVQVCV